MLSIREKLLVIGSTAVNYGGYQIQSAVSKEDVKAIHDYGNVVVLDEDQVEEQAGLGIPVFMSITLKIPDYTYNGGNYGGIGSNKYQGVELKIPCCIVTISGTKHIVETSIYGRSGEVHEMVSMGSYKVQVKGILCDDDKPNLYPYNLQNNLRRIIQYPKAVDVTHPVLNRFGIMNLVIKDFDFPDQQRKTNIIPFSLSCASDTDFQLKLSGDEAFLKQV